MTALKRTRTDDAPRSYRAAGWELSSADFAPLPSERWADEPVSDHAVLATRRVLSEDRTGARFVTKYLIGENIADRERRMKVAALYATFGAIEKAALKRQRKAQRQAKQIAAKA